MRCQTIPEIRLSSIRRLRSQGGRVDAGSMARKPVCPLSPATPLHYPEFFGVESAATLRFLCGAFALHAYPTIFKCRLLSSTWDAMRMLNIVAGCRSGQNCPFLHDTDIKAIEPEKTTRAEQQTSEAAADSSTTIAVQQPKDHGK